MSNLRKQTNYMRYFMPHLNGIFQIKINENVLLLVTVSRLPTKPRALLHSNSPRRYSNSSRRKSLTICTFDLVQLIAVCCHASVWFEWRGMRRLASLVKVSELNSSTPPIFIIIFLHSFIVAPPEAEELGPPSRCGTDPASTRGQWCSLLRHCQH